MITPSIRNTKHTINTMFFGVFFAHFIQCNVNLAYSMVLQDIHIHTVSYMNAGQDAGLAVIKGAVRGSAHCSRALQQSLDVMQVGYVGFGAVSQI